MCIVQPWRYYILEDISGEPIPNTDIAIISFREVINIQSDENKNQPLELIIIVEMEENG